MTMKYSAPKQSLLQQARLADASDLRILILKQSLAEACMENYSMRKSVYKCKLPCSDEAVTCVYWHGRPLMSGTDIAKIVRYRLACRGIRVKNMRKVEEGIVSDLRPLKHSQDFVLEKARSELLRLLHSNGCIKTQKKQKVFFWDKIPHDSLFENALEREWIRLDGGTAINPM